jgi:excisionase family DNA binding protein
MQAMKGDSVRAEQDSLLTVAQVAERLQATPDTVRRWLRDGRLQGIRLGGTRLGYRVAESELQRFVNSGRTAPNL